MARQRDDLDKIYGTARWKRARQTALIRDHYLCQECFRRGKYIQANIIHHIIPLRDDLSKAFDLDNLETICTSCHNKEHPERSGGQKKQRKSTNIYKFYGNND